MKFLVVLMIMLGWGYAGGNYHTATPIETGSLEVGSAAGFVGVARIGHGRESALLGFLDAIYKNEEEVSQLGGPDGYVIPMYDFFVRYGVNSWSDFGFQAVPFIIGAAVRVDYNIALVNNDSFALSIDPAAKLVFIETEVQTLSGNFGLFADVIKSSNTIVSVNAKPGYNLDGSGPVMGGGLLVRHKLNDNSNVVLCWLSTPLFKDECKGAFMLFVDAEWSKRDKASYSETSLMFFGGLAFTYQAF